MFELNSVDSRHTQPASKRCLSGKIVMITGVGTPLGRAAAQLFAYEGAYIVAIDHSEERAETIAAEIQLEGGNARAYQVELASPERVNSTIEDVSNTWGLVDILYNAAATPIANSCKFTALNDNHACSSIKSDPNLILHFCHAVIPGMREMGAGSIINTNPISHHRQLQGDSITALSRKLALVNYTFNIRVNALTPIGATSQCIWDLARIGTSLCQARHARQRLGIMDPNEIAKAALYLATSSLTGKAFLIK